VWHWEPDRFGEMVVREDPERTVAVSIMAFNFRLITHPTGNPYDRTGGWCYFGIGDDTLAKVVHSALNFAPEDEHPQGYGKYLFG